MITCIICLFILTVLFGFAFKVTGVLLKACLWLFFLLPMGLMLLVVGLACCCTLILIPVGIVLFKAGVHIILPE